MTTPHEYVIKVEGPPGPRRAEVHCWTCGSTRKPKIFLGYTLNLALNAHRDQPASTKGAA